MNFKNVSLKEFFKLVAIMFVVVFIACMLYFNYLIEHNILMYGTIIQDSISIFGVMVPKGLWVIIISFIITLCCTVIGLILGFILEGFFKLVGLFWRKFFHIGK